MKKHVKLVSILLVIWVFLSTGCYSNNRKIHLSNNLEEYGEYEDLYLNPDYEDAPVVFPKVVNNDGIGINDYFVVKVTQSLKEVGFHIVLDITYSEEEYTKEIARLEQWSRTYNYNGETGVAKLLYDEQNFNYPAYVSAYNSLLAYEYALILDNNHIIYVYISRIKQGETSLLEEYLPKQYYEKNISIEGFSYSVYHNDCMWKYYN